MEIKSININAFRGIPNLELELDGKSLVLQGENGTGKSSIVDAIEFIFTGQVTHLMGTQSISLENHGTHVNFTREDLKVEMEFKSPSCLFERNLNSFSECPESLLNEFRIAKKGNFILRRSEVLKFIESKPGKRYEFIGTVLGVDPLEKIELEMQRAQTYLKKKIDEKTGKIGKIKAKLTLILGNEINHQDDLLPAINQLLENEGFLPIGSINEMEDRLEELDSLANQGNLEKINAITKISSSIEIVNSSNEDIMKEFIQADSFKTEILRHGISDLSLIKILQNARDILQGTELDKCPLCEQDIDEEELQSRIDERLENLYDLSGSKEKLKKSIKSIKEYLKSLYDYLDRIQKNMELFSELDSLNANLKSEMEHLQIFTDRINYQIFLQGEITRYDFKNRFKELENYLIGVNSRCDEIKENIKTSKKDDKVLNIIQVLQEVKENSLKFKNLQKQLVNCQNQHEIALKIFSTFSNVKKQKIQEIYDSIEQDIQHFYESLHPHESHKNIKLDVVPGRRSSTNLKMEIFGRDNEDPRGLNSEGHLDSLGLCVFLSLVKKFNEDFPVVVLDDVVTTVDSRHRESVCRLLFEEFGDKQLIITTHDAIWSEQLRAAQRAYGLGGKFRNLKIIDWDLNLGPIIRPYKPRWDMINERIEAGDKNCAGNEGRRYLEWLLDEICKTTRAPLTRNDSGRYTVNELLIPARKRLNKLIKDEEFKEVVSESFQNMDQTIIMGNILSHNNLLSGNVSINEVENFCASVRQLHQLMLCPNCKSFIRYYPGLKILRCPNRRCNEPLEIKTK